MRRLEVNICGGAHEFAAPLGFFEDVARVAPTSMIFVPCENGISHNEIENATFDDLAAGANVLLRAMITMANA